MSAAPGQGMFTKLTFRGCNKVLKGLMSRNSENAIQPSTQTKVESRAALNPLLNKIKKNNGGAKLYFI